ncbi:hypothetical protein Q766_07615 [Flavobacterium subsaxonicum WB 4.1-42 = DSM 21790]|uniref:Ig-like domain-containing protein n=2 Tax=Flavobacterium TaxID=237 RepID=A0A0A2N003_9FLAO|nr:hypothetical protein Q766_07615 [Flavobacterium subsaxonicum WB 4.1-42 = DSM 21790]
MTSAYNGTPLILDTNILSYPLQNSMSWWTSNNGASGQAAQINTSQGGTVIALFPEVAPGYEMQITDFSFWIKRTGNAPVNWEISIDGVPFGSGTISSIGTVVPITPITPSLSGLTGTFGIIITTTGATGVGTLLLDNLAFYGSVTPLCSTAVITSVSPPEAPENTVITVYGTGFTEATAITFEEVPADFTIISDTEIYATVPLGTFGGSDIYVIANDGCQTVAEDIFDPLVSHCGNDEIYISEIYSGYQNGNSAIELYNPTDENVFFDGSYVLERYNNIGDTTPANSFVMDSYIAPHQTRLIKTGINYACNITPQGFFSFFNMGPDDNDQFKIKKNGVVIDNIQVPFGQGVTPVYQGYSLIRKPDAIAPSSNFNSADWNAYSDETCTNLGIHSEIVPVVPSITQPQPITVCEGTPAVFTAQADGNASYTYQWKILSSTNSWTDVTNDGNYTGATTGTLTVLNPDQSFNNNQYYCAITSAVCNVVTNAVMLNIYGADVITANIVQPGCTALTGSITITSPLNPAYTYSVNGQPFQASPAFENLAPGPYTITLNNNTGCSPATQNFTIVEATVPPQPFGTPVQPQCSNETGSMVVNAPLGINYTYSINNSPYQSQASFTNLPAGEYIITVKNAEGCTDASQSYTISSPAAVPIPVAQITQPTCSTPASLTITYPIETGYTYSINNMPFQASPLFNNLTPNTYNVVIKNAQGCISAQVPYTITAPIAPAVPTIQITQPDCDTLMGSINVTSPVGPEYNYSINGSALQTATTFNNLSPGNYTITVTDAQGCTATSSMYALLIPAAPQTAVTQIIQPLCGSNQGSIIITAPLGPEYTYSIDGQPYQATTTFNSLSPGDYTVTVKNSNNCTSQSALLTINMIASVPLPIASVQQPTCIDPAGSITATYPVGPEYTYSLNGSTYQASPIFNNLLQGTYSITVKNLNSCTATTQDLIILDVAPPQQPNVQIIQPDCNTTLGSIVVNSPLGTGYTYSLDNIVFQSSPAFTDLSAANYTVTVRTIDGCTSTGNSIIINNAPVQAIPPSTITGPNGLCTGGTLQLENTTTGGQWSSNNTAIAQVDANGVVTGYSPGNVIITYTTGTVCTANAQKAITVYSLPSPHLNTLYYLCFNESDNTYYPIELTSGLTTNAYSFEWFKNNSLINIANGFLTTNQPGEYKLIATHLLSGCSTTLTTVVKTSPAPNASVTIGTDFNDRQTITVHTGPGQFEYSLDGSVYQDEPVFNNVTEGKHIVKVRDTNGCGAIELEVFVINYPRYFTPNGDNVADTWNLKGLSNQHNIIVYIFDRYSKLITTIKPYGAGWDGTFNGKPCPSSDYWFTVVYKSSDGSSKQFKSHFSLLR